QRGRGEDGQLPGEAAAAARGCAGRGARRAGRGASGVVRRAPDQCHRGGDDGCERDEQTTLPHECPSGVSTMTVVALTTATANEPTCRPRSRTASELISDTTRCGPHCISTWAITVSAVIAVTRPTNRLRADRPTPDGSAGGFAWVRANSASSAPAITARPAVSLPAPSCPPSIQRR